MRAFYSNIRNVDDEKYSFHTSFKGVVVRVSPSLIGRTFSLETPKKSINFCILEIDINQFSFYLKCNKICFKKSIFLNFEINHLWVAKLNYGPSMAIRGSGYH